MSAIFLEKISKEKIGAANPQFFDSSRNLKFSQSVGCVAQYTVSKGNAGSGMQQTPVVQILESAPPEDKRRYLRKTSRAAGLSQSAQPRTLRITDQRGNFSASTASPNIQSR